MTTFFSTRLNWILMATAVALAVVAGAGSAL
jgi:hypothetical protein